MPKGNSSTPDANLAGLVQLTDVARSYGLTRVSAGWEAGQPGMFGGWLSPSQAYAGIAAIQQLAPR